MDDALPPQPCPKCSATLAHVRREGQLLEVCTQCRGVWFDPGELTALLEVYRKVDVSGGKPSGTTCPRCRAELREVAFPGTDVLVDRCLACQGVWLDGGELETLQGALQEVVQRASRVDHDPDSAAARAAAAAARSGESAAPGAPDPRTPGPGASGAGEPGGGAGLAGLSGIAEAAGLREDAMVGRALAMITDAAVAAERRSTCPSCGAGLWALRKDGHTVEQCSKCGGSWFDAGELTAMIAVYRRVDAKGGAPTGRKCLRCAAALHEAMFPGTPVKIDACPACNGTWLDKGELEALRAALAPLVTPERDLRERAKELDLEAKPLEQPGCPRCSGAMETFPTRGVAQAERCSKCHGTWLDAGLLSICLGVSRKLKVVAGTPTTRLCVRCPRQPLVELGYPGTGVSIDVCPDCRATWLDAGKLDELVASVAR